MFFPGSSTEPRVVVADTVKVRLQLHPAESPGMVSPATHVGSHVSSQPQLLFTAPPLAVTRVPRRTTRQKLRCWLVLCLKPCSLRFIHTYGLRPSLSLQLSTAGAVTRQEGIGALYRGVHAAVARSFVVGAVRLGTYPTTKSAFGAEAGKDVGFGTKVAAGSTAGILAALAGMHPHPRMDALRLAGVGKQHLSRINRTGRFAWLISLLRDVCVDRASSRGMLLLAVNNNNSNKHVLAR